MTIDWQNALAVALVLAAGTYIARQAWKVVARKKAAGCGGGCPKCETKAVDAGPTVVSLGDSERRS
jgi:hypothetical protein